ncbi:hypothetical protein Pcinc_002620 [Petrolisthes cinctipes]|uniref:Insertion element IS150 protein InsJ-like helix-turn-helix domain-containing protein n=1 Tax=Petrolisthes cinctipes TaxID=88211 RepID=A0AAE1GKH8_PETCI|nr:hypothetical protein Pcinc_002620 [Petrolisthes cinctipes]
MWRKGTNIASVLFKRARIVQLWQKGVAVRNISRKTGASVTTVYRWIRRWKEEGTLKTKSYRRRPRAAAWQREVVTAASSSTVFVKPDYWEQNTELCYYRLLNPYRSAGQFQSLLSIYQDFLNNYNKNTALFTLQR